MTKLDLTEERLRNTRAWAAARVGSLSGADVIVAAIDELLRYREIVGYELAESAPEPPAVEYVEEINLHEHTTICRHAGCVAVIRAPNR